MPSGKSYLSALSQDIPWCATILRYYAGWADKIHGKTFEVSNHIETPSTK